MPAATHTTRYTVDQAVEVFLPDFHTPGIPWTWQPAVVEAVSLIESGLTEVTVRRANGIATVLRVGKRGGNRRLRSAAL